MRWWRRFPRLYAAASLKRDLPLDKRRWEEEFSAALCRGLIEAPTPRGSRRDGIDVFRGFMPRPH